VGIAILAATLVMADEEKPLVALMRATNQVSTGDKYHFHIGSEN
jgi:prolyl-tRNA editing enzyme YbaK/EbsC (Cys-tRNA(Pro) deacylase)